MVEEISIENSKTLIFLDKNKNQCVDDFYQRQRCPDVVMMSSWEKDSSGYQQIKTLIEKLIDMGCKYFVCAGVYSEKLHDFIDDVLLDRIISNQFGDDIDVITTWHDTDTAEEVAEFFLYSTNASNCLLVAFLEQGKREDDELKKALLNLV